MNDRDLMGWDFPVAAAVVAYGKTWKSWKFESVNQEFTRLSGYKGTDLAGKKKAKLFSGANLVLFEDVLKNISKDDDMRKQALFIRKEDQSPCYTEIRLRMISSDESATRILVCFWDTLQKQNTENPASSGQGEAQREDGEGLDPLTQLLDKENLQRKMVSFLEGNQDGTHVMFLIDIDNFGAINEHFGFTFGDTVIADTAKEIQAQFRFNDIIGRVGGDEFLVLMKDAGMDKGVEKAKLLCEVLDREYIGGDVRGRISVSIGIASVTPADRSFDVLFEKADHAMCRAKENGKNSFEIAGTGDGGIFNGSVREFEERQRIQEEDRDFLGFAVSLMAHAKNMDGSMNMLLKRIAERYQLDAVLLFEEQDAENKVVLTNSYANNDIYNERTVYAKLDFNQEGLEPGNYMVINSRHLDTYNEHKKNVQEMLHAEETGPFNCVIVKYEYIADHTGEISYVSLDESREWKKEELESLQELTRTLAIFVALRCRVAESEELVHHIRTSDQLTDFYKQEAFRQVAEDILKKADPSKLYAIEYLDINNFGYINENYGYKVGDSILKMFADEISRQPNFKVGCRLYSDFFLTLVEDDSREQLKEHLERRNTRFTNMQNHQYPNSAMGVADGVYILEDTQMDLEQAVENATLAWKNSKNFNKRGIIFYDSELRTRRAEEQKVLGEFFEALYRDDFQMYLQPKFLLGSRTVYGAEALARWRKPDGKILPPVYFIDSLEKIGYITELDFYIYEELLKTLDKWGRQNKPKMVVSTNFSGRHFDTDGENFLRRIEQILSKYRVSPEQVEIEVTEGVMINNIGVLKKCMNRLHEMGFRVAIDDFGTGYSSLAILADLPADVVKIDKSFISEDNLTVNKLAMLYEIGRMVKILKKDIIIEGVETEDQEALLCRGGFTCGQGYLCNKPISIGEFENLYL